MTLRLTRYFPFFALPFLMLACATPQRQICDQRVQFKDPSRIDFTGNEDLFLCGDEKKDSWKEIPLAQVEFTLRHFFQQRAYYHPEFSYQAGILMVDPGAQSKVTELVFDGQPAGFDDVRLRGVIGVPLTSAVLDRVDGFSQSRLKNMGFACPEVKIQAVQETGVIKVILLPGARYAFTEPRMINNLELYDKTMRRFDAFKLGAPFRYEWTTLSSDRAENDGIVVSSQFVYQCTNPANQRTAEEKAAKKQAGQDELLGLAQTQQILGGEKRVVTLGAGISTEEFPIAQASWKSVRLNDRGASLLFSVYGSSRKQTLQGTYTDYLFKNAPRFSFAPVATLNRRTENSYRSTEFQLAGPLQYKGDSANLGWLAAAGPAINRSYSQGNSDNIQSQDVTATILSLVGRINLMSHDYELYQSDPRSGFSIDFNAELASEGFSLNPLATQVSVSGTNLFKLNAVEPQQWILGFRYELATTITDEDPRTTTRLPAKYYHQLGGDDSLRGFGRLELNNGVVGAKTSAYLGTELRYAKTLKAGIEPFVFFDLGQLGTKVFALTDSLYFSPGFGLRLATPFGAIRTTVAHGYATKLASNSELEHYQFFINFGKEF